MRTIVPIKVYLLQEVSKHTTRITFRLRYYDTYNHSIITELGYKIDFCARDKYDTDAFIRAEKERNKAQADIDKEGYNPDKKKQDLIPFWEGVAQQKSEGTKKCYLAALKHFKRFICAETFPFNKVEEEKFETFRRYLLDTCNEQNTASNTLTNTMAVIHIAERRGLIKTPIIVKRIELLQSPKEYLTIEELELLAKTPCKNNEVRKAFLFSCLSGLRVSDLRDLQYGHIINEHGEYILSKRTVKTNQLLYNHLNDAVKEILSTTGKKTDKVFPSLSKYGAAINHVIQAWVKKAGIDKHISIHCARVTYGTLIMEKTGNLKAVKDALGHKSILSTVWSYGHIKPKAMREATKLDGIPLKLVIASNQSGQQYDLPFSAS